jgi:hypothetical protein
VTLILKCKACGEVVRYETEPDQSMYGAAYVAGARHERDHRNPRCETSAARYLVLTAIEQPGVMQKRCTCYVEDARDVDLLPKPGETCLVCRRARE